MMMTLMMMIFSTHIRDTVEFSILRQHDIKRNSNYLQIMILAERENERDGERDRREATRWAIYEESKREHE